MPGLAATIIVCLTALASAYMLVRVVDRFLTIVEKRAAVLEQRELRPVPERAPPPVDLIQMALNQSTDWARDDSLKALFEMYEDNGRDWNRVRAAFVGGIPVKETDA